MFVSKKELKDLKNEVKRLKEKLSEVPDIKVCSECDSVKSKKAFKKPFEETVGLRQYGCEYKESYYFNDYCDTCAEIIEKREKAVAIAKANPDKVIKCAGKK